MSEVTRILTAIDAGDAQAAARLLPLVYEELRSIAAAHLARETPGQTLQPTALVHEAYLRLVATEAAAREPGWNGRRHFVAAASEAMRHILVDNARRKGRDKRGGGRRRIALHDGVPAPLSSSDDLLAFDEALQRLEAHDPQGAAVVKLRYFGGLSIEEAAEPLGISRATAYRHWTFAKAWLLEELAGDCVEE
jgi:RNA polymerase sigma factor (TIGR02999 family)